MKGVSYIYNLHPYHEYIKINFSTYLDIRIFVIACIALLYSVLLFDVFLDDDMCLM